MILPTIVVRQSEPHPNHGRQRNLPHRPVLSKPLKDISFDRILIPTMYSTMYLRFIYIILYIYLLFA